MSFYENLLGPFSGLFKCRSDCFKTWSACLSPRLLQTPLCTKTWAFKVRHSGAEETNTSLCLNHWLSLQNNKQSQEAHLQQDLRWWMTMCTADRRVTTIFRGIYVGCFGFLILYIFGLENARNLLAEQVYPLCSLTRLFFTEVCFWKIPSANFAAKAAHGSVEQFKPETNPL